MTELRPFLAFLASPTRSLQSALPAVDPPVPDSVSPWSLRDDSPPVSLPDSPPNPEPLSYAQAFDLDALRAEAALLGRADGFRESAALRANLAAAIAALDAARRAIAGPSADLIAEAATAVVAAWAASSDHRALFAPIITRWIARDLGPSTVRVHPQDLDALRAAIADAPLSIETDDEIEPGDLLISNPSFELSHRWEARLRDLRESIATQLSSNP